MSPLIYKHMYREGKFSFHVEGSNLFLRRRSGFPKSGTHSSDFTSRHPHRAPRGVLRWQQEFLHARGWIVKPVPYRFPRIWPQNSSEKWWHLFYILGTIIKWGQTTKKKGPQGRCALDSYPKSGPMCPAERTRSRTGLPLAVGTNMPWPLCFHLGTSKRLSSFVRNAHPS